MLQMIKTAETSKGTTYVFKDGAIVEYIRRRNDVNGNPLYKVFPINFILTSKSDKAYRTYLNVEKPYYLVQSYNINTDIENLLIDVTKDKFFHEFNQDYLTKHNYKNVKTLND